MTSYIREDDGALMVEVSPGCFVAQSRPETLGAKKRKPRSDGDKNHDHLWFIFAEASVPLNAEDASVIFQKKKNTDYEKDNIAPIITAWKKLGVLKYLGRLPTLHGRPASAFILSDNALELFVERYGRNPMVTR